MLIQIIVQEVWVIELMMCFEVGGCVTVCDGGGWVCDSSDEWMCEL